MIAARFETLVRVLGWLPRHLGWLAAQASPSTADCTQAAAWAFCSKAPKLLRHAIEAGARRANLFCRPKLLAKFCEVRARLRFDFWHSGTLRAFRSGQLSNSASGTGCTAGYPYERLRPNIVRRTPIGRYLGGPLQGPRAAGP
jgi:hypothetical protein